MIQWIWLVPDIAPAMAGAAVVAPPALQCHKALAIILFYLCCKSGIHAWLEYFKVAFFEI